VANLIEMVRLEIGAVQREPEAVDRPRPVTRRLITCPGRFGGGRGRAVPEDLPLVLADPRLLHPA
jgi:two-component system sensor histidine kinase KdpD